MKTKSFLIIALLLSTASWAQSTADSASSATVQSQNTAIGGGNANAGASSQSQGGSATADSQSLATGGAANAGSTAYNGGSQSLGVGGSMYIESQETRTPVTGVTSLGGHGIPYTGPVQISYGFLDGFMNGGKIFFNEETLLNIQRNYEALGINKEMTTLRKRKSNLGNDLYSMLGTLFGGKTGPLKFRNFKVSDAFQRVNRSPDQALYGMYYTSRSMIDETLLLKEGFVSNQESLTIIAPMDYRDVAMNAKIVTALGLGFLRNCGADFVAICPANQAESYSESKHSGLGIATNGKDGSASIGFGKLKTKFSRGVSLEITFYLYYRNPAKAQKLLINATNPKDAFMTRICREPGTQTITLSSGQQISISPAQIEALLLIQQQQLQQQQPSSNATAAPPVKEDQPAKVSKAENSRESYSLLIK
ncbi:MAG: hypothetical protein KJ592_00440 [Nanoarchaeota archaeon]|nr:hypothetical protein [Nanoarchaeota archaeon]